MHCNTVKISLTYKNEIISIVKDIPILREAAPTVFSILLCYSDALLNVRNDSKTEFYH